MMDREDKRVALVTGAGRGIGRAIALALAGEGFSLCLAARSRDELEQTRKLSRLEPRRALIVLIDLALEDAPDQLIGAVLDHFGRLEVLVNNAGWAPARTPLVRSTEAQVDRMIALNLRAPIALSRLAAKSMVERGSGTIINIASSAARNTPPGEAVYAATKAGLVAFTRSAFAELGRYGIGMSVIVPGLVDTALIPPNKRLRRDLMLKPEDVASAVVRLVKYDPRTCPVEIALEPLKNPLG